jgi:hypothetical protein
MSFTIIITDIPNKDLGPIIARLQLPRGVDYDIKFVSDHAVPATAKPNGRGGKTRPRADSLLTMTGKVAMKGSKIETAVSLFEKLEKRRGIGTVTVQDFRDHLVKNEYPKALAQRCVTEKFMAYL